MSKNIFIATILVFCVSAFFTPVMAGDVNVSGSVEVQYRNSSDIHKSTGNDKVRPEQLYIQIKKEVDPNIDALIMIDAADMNNETGSSYTASTVEEAQVIFKNVNEKPLTLVFGKDEMPFGQDYEKFYFSTLTHGFEIDKVWGVNAKYDIENFGPLEAAVFKKDTSSRTGLFSSYAVRLTTEKIAEGLTLEASYAKKGKDEDGINTDKETRLSVGGKYKWNLLTVHAESTNFKKYGGKTTSKDPGVIEFGVDYLACEDYLLKGFYEYRNDNAEGDQAGSIKNQFGLGVNRIISESVTLGIEYVTINYEDKHVIYDKDSVGELIVAVNVTY